MSAAPALTLTPQQLSAAAGLVTATMDFPSSEANIPYALLASRAGTGPTNLGGVVVPLTPDVLFNRMVTGWSPPMVQGAFGTLDADGDAQATITGHPSLSRFIGQTVWLAAVSYDPAGPTPRMATNAAALMIRP